MRYETAEAFRTALEQRLKNEAEAGGDSVLRLEAIDHRDPEARRRSPGA